jgi:MEMO1 family protein
MTRIRNAAVAGLFYPGDPVKLKNQVIGFLSRSTAVSQPPARFLMVPHAGYSYSGQIAGEGFAEISSRDWRRVILMGPSHRYRFSGIAATTDTYWETPLGRVKLGKVDHPALIENTQYHRDEHCLEVQLPFLQCLLPAVEVVPLLLSGPFHLAADFSRILSSFDTPETLWVISTDFNHTGPGFRHFPEHYGYRSGAEMDQAAIDLITAGDGDGFQRYLKKNDATICGALPVLSAMHLIADSGLPPFVFKAYDCSGTQTGDVNSVGYAAFYR